MHKLIPSNITQNPDIFQYIYIHTYSVTLFLDPTVRYVYNSHFFGQFEILDQSTFTVQSIPLSEKEESATMFTVLFASAA